VQEYVAVIKYLAFQMDDRITHTARLSRDIDAAFAIYKPGDPDSERALYETLRAQAANVVWHHQAPDGDTLIHEIVHRAMVALKDFRGESAVSTWFWTLARNEVNRALRKKIRNRERSLPIDGDPADKNEEPEGQKPLADIPARPFNSDVAIDLERLQQDLAPEQAEVMRLKAEGNSLEDIANKFGIPLGTARSRYALAKKKAGRRLRKGGAVRSDKKLISE
jgi:RNA polymerase sigma-70 factor (ECF subfamily)